MARMIELAVQAQAQAKAQFKQYYDRNSQARKFYIGDRVLVLLPEDSTGMEAQWHGPYEVVEKTSPVSYKLQFPERKKTRQFHINSLKKWNECNILAVVIATEDTHSVDDLPLHTVEIGSDKENMETVGDLPPEQQEGLRNLLAKYKPVFSNLPGHTDLLQHSIYTGGCPPVNQHPYRISVAWQREVRDEIQQLLALGVIRPSKSPWNSPIVTVRKKEGTLRMCIDYRKLNSSTRDDPYQMPRINEFVEAIGHAKYITTLDLSKGYYQIPVAECDKPKTAFASPFGKFEFN